MNPVDMLELVRLAPAPAVVIWEDNRQVRWQANPAAREWAPTRQWASSQWQRLVNSVAAEHGRQHDRGQDRDLGIAWRSNGVARPQLVWLSLPEAAKPDPARVESAQSVNEDAQAQLAMAEELVGLSTFRTDLATLRVHVNDIGLKMAGLPTGVRPEGIPVSRIFEQVHPDDVAQKQAAVQRLRQTDVGALNEEARYRQPDGSYKLLLIRRKALLDQTGNPHTVLGVGIDITEQREWRDRLRLSEARADLAVAISGYGWWMFDQTTGAYVWDEQMYRMRGLDPSDPRAIPQIRAATMTSEDMLALVDYQSRLLREYSEVPQEHQRIGPAMEFRVLHADGAWRQFRSRGALVRVADRGPILMGVHWDVTAETHLQQMQRDHVAVQEQNRFKARFLANISHEIRTPMNAIIGMAHLAAESGLDARQQGYVSKIQRAGQSLLGLVDDVLEFSRFEANNDEGGHRGFLLGEVLRRLNDRVGLSAEDKGLELLFMTATDLPTALVGDAPRLLRVLSNLTANAVKFSERGEIVVEMRRVSPAAALDGHAVDGHAVDGRIRLRFEVRDTGPGISQEVTERLFQPFEQADSSMSRRFGGTGLGLAISQQLVRAMGGQLTVSSELGQGSVFRFELDFDRIAESEVTGQFGPASGAAAEPLATLPPGARILVVDDNATARLILVSMAQSLGLHTDEANDGEQAVAAVNRAAGQGRPYDALVLDWRMPVMDGVECARRLQADQSTTVPPVLMTTAFGNSELRAEIKASGVKVASVLLKPVSASGLLEALQSTLGRLPSAGAARSQREKREQQLLIWKQQVQGRRILLAEDNELNQELAVEILQNAGAIVTVVENGQQAIDAVARENFDCVLMDCQMPLVDGYQASLAIRTNPRALNLPIIAMTANARTSDRGLSLAAGMNDHIAKPLDIAGMFEILARWMPGQPAGAAAPSAVPPPAAMPAAMPSATPVAPGWPTASRAAEPAIGRPKGKALKVSGNRLDHLPGIDARVGRRSAMDDDHLYARLLNLFRLQNLEFASRLRQALAGDDLVAARRLAHDLAASAGALGALQVQQTASKIELACVEQASLRQLQTLLLETLRELSPVLDGLADLNPEEL